MRRRQLATAPVGTLKTATMPKKREAKGGDSEHEKEFYAWMRTSLVGKVRARTHAHVCGGKAAHTQQKNLRALPLSLGATL